MLLRKKDAKTRTSQVSSNAKSSRMLVCTCFCYLCLFLSFAELLIRLLHLPNQFFDLIIPCHRIDSGGYCIHQTRSSCAQITVRFWRGEESIISSINPAGAQRDPKWDSKVLVTHYILMSRVWQTPWMGCKDETKITYLVLWPCIKGMKPMRAFAMNYLNFGPKLFPRHHPLLSLGWPPAPAPVASHQPSPGPSPRTKPMDYHIPTDSTAET